MRLGQVFSYLGGGAPAPGRTAGPPGAARSGASLDDILDVEIVQLSLHNDGIWHPEAASTAGLASSHTSPRHPPRTLTLAASGLRLYLPTGQAQVRTPTVGLIVDLYA